jgi:hypothetical protein
MQLQSENPNIYTSPAPNCANSGMSAQNIVSISPPRLMPTKSPIRKLNFNEAAQLNRNGLMIEINKVPEKELTRFIQPGAEPLTPLMTDKNAMNGGEDSKEVHNLPFYQLRTSPMQMFNSFSPNEAYLAQTITQKYGKGSQSDSKFVTKKMCCNCKKSHCLKLYCECFVNKAFCSGCNCCACMNNESNTFIREKAMQSTLDRNPTAFDPKIARDNMSVLIDLFIS